MPPELRSAGSPASTVEIGAPASRREHTYTEILKSSVLIGGSSVLTLAIGVVRTKAMSILLGPTGFGLMGIYGSIADLARSLSELGINASGVRQIAAATSSGDGARIARTVTVLRRVALVLAAFGAIALVAFASPVSRLTFGDNAHTAAIALLSLAVAFRLIADAQGALIQGMRRIGDYAQMGVLGALLGTVVGIPLVYFLREDGVVPALVAVAAMSIAVSWWYSRKVRVERVVMTTADIAHETGALLKLGVAFMGSGFLMMGSAYAVRIIVLRNAGLDATGFYQAAWTIGGLYVGFVLQAMGADFYPRLVGVAHDRDECNRVVNEQAHVSLLLAAPGVVATLACAPLVIHVLYTSEFEAAVGVLRWIALGMALRIVSWPMGFIIVAKGEQQIFFLTELAWTIVGIGLAWLLVARFGLDGAGMAFFGSYVFHGLMIYPIVRKLSGFRWSAANLKAGLMFVGTIALAFTALMALPGVWGTAIALLVTLATSLYSLDALLLLVPLSRLPRFLRPLALRCRRGRAAPGE
jgi:PST family polysaccharide transporter